MKKSIVVLVLLFVIFQINAQIAETKKIEHGVLFSSRIDSDDDFSFNIKGFGIEGGYYFLKKVGARGMISIDVRLAYAQSERSFENVIDQSGFFLLLDTITTRTGIVNYKNLSLAVPIKYRFQLSSKLPLFLLAGVNPYFNLSNNTVWNYDEFESIFLTDTVVAEINNQQEDVNQSTFSHDIILAGFGYKKDKLMLDLYFSGGNINFENDFISGMDKLSIVLNAYYRLN